MRANFHLDDDAYIVVGHIDADGVLRIEFPDTPIDNGFARGARVISDRAVPRRFRRPVPRAIHDRPQSQREHRTIRTTAALGCVFVIASWQPMHFEKFSTDGFWDSFELTDADYMTNPRPAVYELAALLAGTNSSSYTVSSRSVYDTQTPTRRRDSLFSQLVRRGDRAPDSGSAISFGFASSPFGFSAFNPVSIYGYGQSFCVARKPVPL